MQGMYSAKETKMKLAKLLKKQSYLYKDGSK